MGDGIQIGTINHFPVHGSTGGPKGLVNLEFVEDLRFSAGGFSAIHGDRLSSIFYGLASASFSRSRYRDLSRLWRDRAFDNRYPTCHSLNLRISRRDVVRGSVLRSYFAFWNPYGRKNASDYCWNELDNRRDTAQQWGFLPVLGCEWKF